MTHNSWSTKVRRSYYSRAGSAGQWVGRKGPDRLCSFIPCVFKTDTAHVLPYPGVQEPESIISWANKWEFQYSDLNSVRKAGAENHNSTWQMWAAKPNFFPHSTRSGRGVHWVLPFQRRSEMFATSNCFLYYKKRCGLSLRISVLCVSGRRRGRRRCCFFWERPVDHSTFYGQINLLSVQFSRSVMSDSLQPHEPQHARPPCPSPTPGVYPISCTLSRWCHPTISPSVISFFSRPQSFLASGYFLRSQLFASGGHAIGVLASTSFLPMNPRDWSPLGWTGWISLQSKGLSRVFSSTTVQRHQFFGAQLS